jgi:hypothetical protein
VSTKDKLEYLRPKIGTLAHNRSFTAREISEYTRFNGSTIILLLVRRGLIARTEHKGSYYPTPTGWDWIEGTQ